MATTTAVAPLRNLRSYLEESLPRIANAGLASHVTPERQVRVALTMATRQPKLAECTPESFLMALIEAGQLGLEPGGVLGQAYLVPYGKTVQFIPGYRGLVDLCLRTGDVTSADARAVYEGDTFEYAFGLTEKLEHVPCGESAPEKLTHVYVIFRLKEGAPKFDVMTRNEVEAIRKRSQARNSGPWVTDYTAMALKTVVKRGVKLLRMSPELGAAIAKDDSLDIGSPIQLSNLDPTYGEPEEPEPKDPSATSKGVEAKLEGVGATKAPEPTPGPPDPAKAVEQAPAAPVAHPAPDPPLSDAEIPPPGDDDGPNAANSSAPPVGYVTPGQVLYLKRVAKEFNLPWDKVMFQINMTYGVEQPEELTIEQQIAMLAWVKAQVPAKEEGKGDEPAI